MEETNVLHKKKVIAPKLRFKEFNDEWVNIRLKDLTNLITKGTTPQSFSSEGINYVKIEGLVGVNINKEKCLYIDEQTHNKELRRSILQNNDLLFAIAGATIGKVAIVTEDILPANTNQALAIIRLKNSKNLKYTLQILQSRIMKKYIQESISVGAQPNLNLEQMGDFRFHMPSLPEQQKIASFLSAVDEKIQLLTRKKQLLEQYKKGVMQHLFSGKMRFKDENEKAYPKWQEKRLGEVAVFLKGKGISKLDIDNEGDIECIRYGQLYTNYKETISNVISRTNLSIKELILSEANDVIIPASGETQMDIATASCVMRSGIALGGDLNIIRTNLNGVFLSYYLNTQKKTDIARLSQGITVVHLYPSQLSLLKLLIPCIEEQKKISEFLSAIDVKIESLSNQITQTQNFKKGLLQQMFV